MQKLRHLVRRAACIGFSALALFHTQSASVGAEGPTVLPKFEVNDSRQAYHVAIPGYEILSYLEPVETARFANQLQRQSWILRMLLPPGRHSVPPIPATIVLGSRIGAQIKNERVNDIRVTPPDDKVRGWRVRDNPAALFTKERSSDDHLTLSENRVRAWQVDDDTFTLFSEYQPNVPAAESSVPNRVELQATLIWLEARHLLRVPRWYADELIASLALLESVASDKASWYGHWTDGAVPPLSKFLSLWESEFSSAASYPVDAMRKLASLFVQKNFWEEDEAHRTAFLDFVDRATNAAVTEAMFRETFGMNFAAMDRVLKSYAPKSGEGARGRPKFFEVRNQTGKTPREISKADVNLAPPAFEARVMGGVYLAEGSPAVGRPGKSGYLDRARRVLTQAYQNVGDRDPLLLAALGFLELASGQPDKAASYLERAAAAKIFRPKVYVELGRIRLNRALAISPSFDDATVAHILEPLLTAHSQIPEMQDIYEVMIEVEARRRTVTPDAELRLLKEHVWCGNDTAGLVGKTALLFAKHHRTRDALRLLDVTLMEPSLRATGRSFRVGGGDNGKGGRTFYIGSQAGLVGNDDRIVAGTLHTGIIPENMRSRRLATGGFSTRRKLYELRQHLWVNDGKWSEMSFSEFD